MNASKTTDEASIKHLWARALLALAMGVQALALAPIAHGAGFEPIPTCGQCPPIVDDPAKMCDATLRWGFSYDPTDRVPNQPSGTPLESLIDPTTHDYQLWVFFGSAGLASPTACTPDTCLFQEIPRGSFTEVGEGRFSYKDPTAATGAMRFISAIGFAQRQSGLVHVTVRGLAETPADGKISLVLTQIGNTVPLPGGGSSVEPTVSFGIDRRHEAWKDKQCGWALHDAGGAAPDLFCAPPLTSQCEVVPNRLCPKRLHLPAASIRQSVTGGFDTVELHVAVTRSTNVVPSAQAFTATLTRANAPTFSVELASLSPGDLHRTGAKYKFESSLLDVVMVPRNNGELVIDAIVKVSLPPVSSYDDLLVTIDLGPDSYAMPAQPGPWRRNSQGELVLESGTPVFPLCPAEP